MPWPGSKSRASATIWDSGHLRDPVGRSRRDRPGADVRDQRIDIETGRGDPSGAELQVGEAVAAVGQEVVGRDQVAGGRIDRGSVP